MLKVKRAISLLCFIYIEMERRQKYIANLTQYRAIYISMYILARLYLHHILKHMAM